MRVTIKGKNIELTNALKSIVEKKLDKLSKYFSPAVEANATLSVYKNDHTIEVTIPFNGVILRGEETNDDMYASIDLVLDKLERQIRKQKTKLQRRNNGDSLRFQYISNFEDRYMDTSEPAIVRTKRFAMKPMAVEEAVLQMELLGHNFYVFESDENGKVNVVYKRKDGDYGLIEPER